MLSFDEVVRRKTAAAAAADLPALRTIETGVTNSLEPVGNGWTRAKFDGDFFVSPPAGDLPSTNLVFVQSADGNTGTRNPSSLGGGATDKHLIYEGLSRVAADGVLAGAETVRATSVVLSVWRQELAALRASRGLPRHPIQIVATTGRLTLDDTLMLNVPELRAIVLAPGAWIARFKNELARRPWISCVPAPENELRPAFVRLRQMGVARISAIGGRTLARAMLDAALVSDLYLTTSPRPGGEPDTPLYRGAIEGALVVRKRGTGNEEGVTFEHVKIARHDR
jgi:riboflavin biosynthesis pyrimidine reductase